MGTMRFDHDFHAQAKIMMVNRYDVLDLERATAAATLRSGGRSRRNERKRETIFPSATARRIKQHLASS